MQNRIGRPLGEVDVQMTAQSLERDIRRVRATGTTVHALMPGREDLAAIGGPLCRRRAKLVR